MCKLLKFIVAAVPSLISAVAIAQSVVTDASRSPEKRHLQPIESAEIVYKGIGRKATPAEIAAWDIDVRPDFKGLPKGEGSVRLGEQVWETKCTSCHGTFGESNEVFSALIGHTKADDVKTGRVKALTEGTPRTTMMKLSQISTLWDYINRAMPWNAPKSLSANEVYATTAYMLHLADLVPADYVLSHNNIAQAQQLLPNRNGLKKFDALWDINGKGDVVNVLCERHCEDTTALSSYLPEYARNASGNLAEQQRLFGATRGTETATAASAVQEPQQPPMPMPMPTPVNKSLAATQALAKANNCMACHAPASALVGPSFKQIAEKYAGNAGAATLLSAKIKTGGSGVWGAIPMPAYAALSDADLKKLAEWSLAGAPAK